MRTPHLIVGGFVKFFTKHAVRMYAYISSIRYSSLEKSEIRINKFYIMGLIGDLFTFGVGQIMNQVSQDKQFANEQYMMDKQAEYNKELAKYSSELQKQMWDYTNYENQKKHMEAAGLNPALMYGMSGGGGSTTGNASAGSVSNPGTQAVGMGLQAAMIASQIRLNESETSKNNAEADKTRGVDTDLARAQENLTKFNARLSELKGYLTQEDIDNAKTLGDKLVQEVRLLENQADIAEETKENEIEMSAQKLLNMQWEGFLKQMQGELTAEEVKIAKEKIEMMWYGLITDRRNSDAAKENAYTRARELEELVKKWNKELDQTDQRITQDYILGGADIVVNFIEAITDLLPTKKANEIIERVFSSDNKGNWRSTTTTKTEKGGSRKGR